MSKRETRQDLLDAGSALFLERGYASTGLADILAVAGVPKGSFYHHFKSKEDFALEVVDRYGTGALAALEGLVRDTSRPPRERIRVFFEAAFEDFKSRECRHGCLLGNLGQELADAHPPIRVAIESHLERWARAIAGCLDEAVAAGDLPAGTDTTALGRLMIDGFQGAALSMKLERSPAALERYLDHFFGARRAA